MLGIIVNKVLSVKQIKAINFKQPCRREKSKSPDVWKDGHFERVRLISSQNQETRATDNYG